MQKELEAIVQLENYNLITITEIGMIHLTGIPPLRSVSFLENVDKARGVGELSSMLRSG